MVNAITTENVNVFYGDKQAINNISLNFLKNKVTALIGPSGCCLLYTSDAADE